MINRRNIEMKKKDPLIAPAPVSYNPFDPISEKLDVIVAEVRALKEEKKGESPACTEWMTSSSLGKRYEMSGPTIWRHLEKGVNEGKIRRINPSSGEGKREGTNRFNVADVDAYLASISTWNNK